MSQDTVPLLNDTTSDDEEAAEVFAPDDTERKVRPVAQDEKLWDGEPTVDEVELAHILKFFYRLNHTLLNDLRIIVNAAATFNDDREPCTVYPEQIASLGLDVGRDGWFVKELARVHFDREIEIFGIDDAHDSWCQCCSVSRLCGWICDFCPTGQQGALSGSLIFVLYTLSHGWK